MALLVAIDLVDQPRKRGALAGPGGPADQHEATRKLCQLFYRRRQAESGEAWYPLRQQPDRRSGASAFPMEVDAESTCAGNAEGRVRNRHRLIESPGMRCERGEDCVFDIHAVERTLAERLKTSVHPDGGRRTRHQEQVTASLRRERLKPALEP